MSQTIYPNLDNMTTSQIVLLLQEVRAWARGGKDAKGDGAFIQDCVQELKRRTLARPNVFKRR